MSTCQKHSGAMQIDICMISYLLRTVPLIKPWTSYKHFMMMAYVKTSREFYVAMCLKNAGFSPLYVLEALGSVTLIIGTLIYSSEL